MIFTTSHLIYAAITLLCCMVMAPSLLSVVSAFQPTPNIVISPVSRVFSFDANTILPRDASSTQIHLQLIPEMQDDLLHQLTISFLPSTSLPLPPTPSSSSSSSIMLTAEKLAEWRQYVPLVVSVGVILDILLGSPLANMALGPMKRASEKGVGGDSTNRNESDDNSNSGGSSLFSAFSGSNNNLSSGGGSRGKERVDSEAIAQAALNKALNTLELKRFLEENKTDEQRYEEVRRKIDKQMEDLED